MTLSFGVMLGFFQQAIAEIKDPRLASNATCYSIKEAMLGAFSVFFMQWKSFLEHQRQMHSRHGQDNVQSLFGLTQIPTTPQIRNILDEIAAKGLFRVFTWVYQSLHSDGYLKPYHYLNGHLLVTLNGTQYFSSQTIHCECCSSRKGFFQDILSLSKYLLFDSWQHLIDFMLSDSVFSPATDSS